MVIGIKAVSHHRRWDKCSFLSSSCAHHGGVLFRAKLESRSLKVLVCFAEANKTYKGLILKTATPFFSYDEQGSAIWWTSQCHGIHYKWIGCREMHPMGVYPGKWPGYGMLVLAYVGLGANLKRRNLICCSHTLSWVWCGGSFWGQ